MKWYTGNHIAYTQNEQIIYTGYVANEIAEAVSNSPVYFCILIKDYYIFKNQIWIQRIWKSIHADYFIEVVVEPFVAQLPERPYSLRFYPLFLYLNPVLLVHFWIKQIIFGPFFYQISWELSVYTKIDIIVSWPRIYLYPFYKIVYFTRRSAASIRPGRLCTLAYLKEQLFALHCLRRPIQLKVSKCRLTEDGFAGPTLEDYIIGFFLFFLFVRFWHIILDKMALGAVHCLRVIIVNLSVFAIQAVIRNSLHILYVNILLHLFVVK